MSDIYRALTEAEVGSVLLQPEIDKVIRELVDYRNPLRQNLPRKPGTGQAWILNRRTAGTTPGAFVSDTQELIEDTSNYVQVSFPYKTIATRGKVTRKLQATGMTYQNILAMELEAKAKDFANFEEFAILWGNKLVNTNAFDGLHQLMDPSQVVATTNAVTPDGAGAPLTLSILDKAIDKIVGRPNLIICSTRTRRQINALLQAQQQFVNMTEIAGGFRVMTYAGIPILDSNNVFDDWFFDGTNIVGRTGTTSTLFILDTSEVFMGVLTEVKTEPLAKKSSQYDEFDIYCDETLVVGNPYSMCEIVGIAGE